MAALDATYVVEAGNALVLGKELCWGLGLQGGVALGRRLGPHGARVCRDSRSLFSAFSAWTWLQPSSAYRREAKRCPRYSMLPRRALLQTDSLPLDFTIVSAMRTGADQTC